MATSGQVPTTAGTSDVTRVADAASSTAILAAKESRRGAIFYNDSSADLYLLLNPGTASTVNFSVKVLAAETYELPSSPVYTGAITGIWSSNSTGGVQVTELT